MFLLEEKTSNCKITFYCNCALQMEVNCLTLKDLINPRQPRLDFAIEDGENAQKVSALKYLKL